MPPPPSRRPPPPPLPALCPLRPDCFHPLHAPPLSPHPAELRSSPVLTRLHPQPRLLHPAPPPLRLGRATAGRPRARVLRAAASGHAPWGGRQCGWSRVRLQHTRRRQGAQCARRRRNRQRLRLLGLLLRERRLRSSRRADADVGLGLGVCRRADGSELLLPCLNFYQLPSRSCQSQTTGRTRHQQCWTGLHAGEHRQHARGTNTPAPDFPGRSRGAMAARKK